MKIIIPTYEYIQQILALNSRYLISHLNNEQKEGGFIRIEYTRDNLQKIIAEKEIVIALKNNVITGYYLIGRKSEETTLDYQKNKAMFLDTRFSGIGYGCQVCIEEAYRNNGLFGQMLRALVDAVRHKYTHLLCSVSVENIVSMKTHLNNGWQVIEHSETTNFLLYQIQ